MVIRNSCAPSKTVDLSVAEIAGPVGMLLDRPLRHRPLVRALTGSSCCGGCMIRSRANGPDDASLLPGRAGAARAEVREVFFPASVGGTLVRSEKTEGTDTAALRQVAVGALARTTGSPLAEGNGVRVLQDAPENYPAWEEAIGAAQRTVHIEMYIFRADASGGRFAALLAERAAAGVKVRVLCDWFGCWSTPQRLFRQLQGCGGEVRYFNPPHPANPIAALRRNHRKVICVDGSVAFISGLCIADPWMGDRTRGIPPWRDTGVELR